jgi:hypothetical protein
VVAEVVEVDAEHDRGAVGGAIGANTSISSALQWKQRSPSFSRYAARSISW